jgi:SpoVK/Ycf46/Vps4 family AAA+-type ATPase
MIIAPYEYAPDDIVDCFVFSDTGTHTFEYLVKGSNGRYTTIERRIAEEEVSIEDNYNDDIPYQEMCDFIEDMNKYGLAIFRGAPGTGKSSLLRHFIAKFPEREFLYLDPSAFDSIGDGEFINELSDHENAIIILEDCEVLLKKRIEGGDPKLTALLNLSDGILGDGFKLHFICTINTTLDKLDDALLRKGRLRINYEFRPLTAEKTAALAEKLGKDVPEGAELTLGDIFNYDEVVEFGKKKEKHMGFRL